MKRLILLILASAGLVLVCLSAVLSIVRQQSPRSHQITYVEFGQDVSIQLWHLGHEPQTIMRESQSAYLSPRWSPDGRRLLYSRSWLNELKLQQLERGAPQSQNIPFDFGNPWGATWSPNGEDILFAANLGSGTNLYRMGLDGRNFQPLTDTRDSNFDPAWHGNRVVFVSLRDTDLELYLLDMSTLQTTRLTERIGDDMFPSWSPDGDWILYTAKMGRQLDLYKIRPDGSEKQALTQTLEQDEYYAAWSPHGEQIIFASTEDYGAQVPDWDLEMMQADGSQRQVLLNDPHASEVMPSWMPIIDLPWRGGVLLLFGALIGWGAGISAKS